MFRDNHRTCPRCGSALAEAHTVMGHRFERCAGCHGNWIDMNTLRRLFEAMKPGAGMPVMEQRLDWDDPLICPACGKPLTARRLHELDLDCCDSHGVWFDGKELETTLYRYALAP